MYVCMSSIEIESLLFHKQSLETHPEIGAFEHKLFLTFILYTSIRNGFIEKKIK